MKWFILFLALGTGHLAMAQDILPVCERTPAVTIEIVNQVNALQGVDKACEDVSVDDLMSLTRLAVQGRRIAEFKVGDFSGLTNLEILNIRSNPYQTLPEGLFRGLTNLKTLVIISAGLRYYPDDFLLDTPNLENCHCFDNQVRSISESVFQRLESMTSLKILDFDFALQDAEKERLRDLFPVGGAVTLDFF